VRNNLGLFVGLAAAVLLVALVMFFVPVIRGGWSRLSSATSRPTASPPARPNPLVKGFGYLYVTPRFAPHRHTVEDRLQRAFARIDAVDPDAAPRRIGLALLQASLDDSSGWPARPRQAATEQGRPRREQPGETR
jgi:hypothetical protein